MTKSIAIVGAKGFIGSVLSQVAGECGFRVREVSRDDYDDAKKQQNFDFVVNTAMPSGRFAAKNNPRHDFHETVTKTFDIKNDFEHSKIIQISSISARVQLDTVYGRHKLAAEGLLDPTRDLIVRLGPLYHPSLSKGALIDIINDQHVYVDANTKYAFTPLEWACRNIFQNLDHSGVKEIGAKNYIILGDLAKMLGSSSEFSGQNDDQVFHNADDSAPDAQTVVEFAKSRKNSSQDQSQ